MKSILYIYFGEDFSNDTSGVQKKIISKIKLINSEGIKCDCISVSANVSTPYSFNENISVLPLRYKRNSKFFNSFYKELSYYNTLIDWLKENESKYSIILFRYPLASYGLYKLLSKFPNKIVFEHNTKEIEELSNELKNVRKKIPFSIKPGFFLYLFEVGYLPILLEKFLAPFIFKKAIGGISVTREIAKYEQQRQAKYNNYVVSNGIDVTSNQLHQLYLYNCKEINLFMLKGNPALWHGVDRIIKGLENYKGDKKITVDLIGNINSYDNTMILASKCKNQINIIPSVSHDKLVDYLKNYHAGIGSLGMHRIGLMEACPLKVREYFGFGFPCIIGYDDTDLMECNDFLPYYLQIPSDESPVDFIKVEKFIESVYSDENHPKKIRLLALKFLDTKVKMQQLTDILKSLDIQRNKVVISS